MGFFTHVVLDAESLPRRIGGVLVGARAWAWHEDHGHRSVLQQLGQLLVRTKHLLALVIHLLNVSLPSPEVFCSSGPLL